MKLLKTQIDEITWKIGVFTKDGNFPLGEIVATRNTDSRFEFDFNLKSDSETLLHRLDNSLDDIYKWLNDPTRASDLKL